MNARDVIEKFCEINQRVSAYLGNQENAKCFCGSAWQGGLLEGVEREGLEENGYKHDGKTIEFVHQAVTEKMMRGRKEHDITISVQALKRENQELYAAVRDAQAQRDAVSKAHEAALQLIDDANLERDSAIEARDKANDVVEDISAFCRERNGFFASYHAAEVFADLLIKRFLPNYRDADQGQNTVSE
jgi:hypothetical protein